MTDPTPTPDTEAEPALTCVGKNPYELANLAFELDFRLFAVLHPPFSFTEFSDWEDDPIAGFLDDLDPVVEAWTVAWEEKRSVAPTTEETAKARVYLQKLVGLFEGDRHERGEAREELARELCDLPGMFVQAGHADRKGSAIHYGVTHSSWFWGPTYEAALDRAITWAREYQLAADAEQSAADDQPRVADDD